MRVLRPRWSRRLAERLALRLPAVEPGALWFHAASVGEGRVADAVMEALRGPGGPVFLRTATTPEGLATGRAHHAACLLPLDLPRLVGRWLDRVRPRALVLVEADLWPGMLLACHARRLPVVVLGARAGRGTRRFRRWAPGLFGAITAPVAAWYATGPEEAREVGAWARGRVEVVGPLKGSLPSGSPPLRFHRPPFVAGSTRPGDEAALLDAWGRPDLPPLVLAPRHPERFEEVARLVEGSGLPWARRSALPTAAEVPAGVRVVLLDTLGELAALYPLAAAAFVGGTFDPRIGGHAPDEPAAAGLPVVAGPHRAAAGSAWRRVRLHEAATPARLGDAVRSALAASPAGGSCRSLPAPGVAAAAERLRALLDLPPLPERTHRPLLRPLGAVVAAATRARRRLRPRPPPAPLPVVAVGNLAVGGTGKTPAVAWLLEALQARGRRPVAVARGHRRDPAGDAVRWWAPGEPAPSASWLGDELAMLARRGWPVVSSPDRRAGLRRAAGLGDVAVLDDAFQALGVHRDLDVLVLDAAHPRAGGVFPAGAAREPLEAAARADVLWVVGDGPREWPLAPGAVEVRVRIRPAGWSGGGAPRGPVRAFAGIARPGRFLALLAAEGVDVRGWRTFPDHHPYDAADRSALRAWGAGLPLVTTEKDAARLDGDPPCRVLRVRAEPIDPSPLERVLDRLLGEGA